MQNKKLNRDTLLLYFILPTVVGIFLLNMYGVSFSDPSFSWFPLEIESSIESTRMVDHYFSVIAGMIAIIFGLGFGEKIDSLQSHPIAKLQNAISPAVYIFVLLFASSALLTIQGLGILIAWFHVSMLFFGIITLPVAIIVRWLGMPEKILIVAPTVAGLIIGIYMEPSLSYALTGTVFGLSISYMWKIMLHDLAEAR